jgi:predicted  nucleic acid-binding Zn-ribbon protein
MDKLQDELARAAERHNDLESKAKHSHQGLMNQNIMLEAEVSTANRKIATLEGNMVKMIARLEPASFE